MDVQKVDLFMMLNSKFFEGYQLAGVRDRLLTIDDSKWAQVQSLQFKDPIMFQLVSLMGGYFGIDRFLIGDTGLGVAKLLTCGGFGVWNIVDWFLIQSAVREKNIMMLKNVA